MLVKHISGTARLAVDNCKLPSVLSGVYYTHNNGGRPYKVVININNIQIFNNYSDKLLLDFDNPEKVFVGESPKTSMTEYSNGYGDDFIGNSVLVKSDEKTYYFIGHNIFKFTTESEIVNYVSEVGNNDVPYPYAIDSKGKYYLMIEDIILEKITDEFKKDPYQYYYKKDIKNMTNIVSLTATDNNEKQNYHMTYCNNPREKYHYEWMKDLHAVEKTDSGVLKEYPLSEDEYVQIMEDIAIKCGYKKLESTVIHY